MTLSTVTQSAHQHSDEYILVIKRELLFPHQAFQGLDAANIEQYVTTIQMHQEFQPRSVMETDARYKQVIPYLIFEHGGRYFLMQRKAKASETRLQSKFTLGIGGHMRKEDLIGSTSLFDWARREFHEEVAYQGSLHIEPLGLLNDDSNAVGEVHVGFVLLLHGDSDQIFVKEELQSGRLATLDECNQHADRLETWSQIVLTTLMHKS